MRNIILGILGIVITIWAFNVVKYNQLQDRFQRASEEHERLVSIITKQEIMLDSLNTVYENLGEKKLVIDTPGGVETIFIKDKDN
jgi:uncharacterized membrane protein YwzB